MGKEKRQTSPCPALFLVGIVEKDDVKAITNFQLKLPEPQSDLAEQTLKDPYNFDFLTMREEYDEKELEDALVNQITQFLLELNKSII